MDETKILQAVEVISGQLERVQHRLDGLEGRFDGLEGRFDGLEARFETQEGRQGALESKFDELHRHFDVVTESLHGDIQLVGEGLSALSERHDRFEVAVHQEFLATRALLEPPTRAIGRRVSHLEEDVDDLRGRVGRLEAGRG